MIASTTVPVPSGAASTASTEPSTSGAAATSTMRVGELLELGVLRDEVGLAVQLDERAAGPRRGRSAAATSPFAVVRSARLPMSFAPLMRRYSTALSKSPSDSSSARLQSIIPAPVSSRSRLTSAALIVAISASSLSLCLFCFWLGSALAHAGRGAGLLAWHDLDEALRLVGLQLGETLAALSVSATTSAGAFGAVDSAALVSAASMSAGMVSTAPDSAMGRIRRAGFPGRLPLGWIRWAGSAACASSSSRSHSASGSSLPAPPA